VQVRWTAVKRPGPGEARGITRSGGILTPQDPVKESPLAPVPRYRMYLGPMTNEATFSTGQLADAADVGVQTVRYYERIGILPEPERSSGGYRQYRNTDLLRLRFIRSAQELGFTLDEIRELLALRVEEGRSCADVAATADRVIERIDRQMSELDGMRRALAELRRACETETPTGECPILKTLEEDST